MASIAEALAAALDHHMAGRLAEAEILYGRILEVEEDQADALHLLGVLCAQTGRAGRAVPLLRRALARRPDAAGVAGNLAKALEMAGDAAGAVAALARVVLADPGDAGAWARLGPGLWRLGRNTDAAAALQRAVALIPGDGESAGRLGLLLHGLAMEDHRAGRLAAARGRLLRAAVLIPDAAETRVRLAVVLHALGDRAGAMAALCRALALDPAAADGPGNLCGLIGEMGRSAAAVVWGRRAVRLAAGEGTWINLAAAFDRCWDYDAAAAACARALALDPAHAGALANRGGALLAQGRVDAALPLLARAVAVRPEDATLGQRWLYTMLFRPDLTGAEVLAAARSWAGRHAAPVPAGPRPPAPGGRPEVGRLRVGMVSGDFRNHAFAFYLEPLFRAFDRGTVELCLYSTTTAADAKTDRFRALADRWCDAAGLSDAALAARIGADGVQVLVDLAAHTEGNRLPLFARRPAPVQVTLPVNVVTTGLSVFDAAILDPWLVPPGAEAQYAEPVERLDRLSWAYRGPEEAPAVVLPPCLERGHVTFASFNNLSKLTPLVAALWARVLEAVPGSRLLLKYPALRDEGARAHIRGLFAAHGVADRLELRRPPSGVAANLGDYADADIALDPFPFTGHTTTCEALWMGVPVVALAAPPQAPGVARVSAAMLENAGLPELVAADADAYVAIAAALAGDPGRLAQRRAGLRAQVASSPLGDVPALARALEGVWQRLWLRDGDR